MTLTRARHLHMLGSLALAGGLSALLWNGLDIAATHPVLAGAALALFGVNALWLSAAAVTALTGFWVLHRTPPVATATIAPQPPRPQCAILWLVCGEPPEPMARRIAAMIAGLEQTGQAQSCTVFVLSDTGGAQALEREKAALEPFGNRIIWRNRSTPEGRKPGNLQDWLEAHGDGFDTMLVLDADSGFSAGRLAHMRAAMAADPQLGLVQAAINLRPGHSRIAAMQRLSARLCGPVFAHGLAHLSGDAGNYWGHNALVRVAAFAKVAQLAPLSGRPPFGGPVLSHDFVEAALMRAAGWRVCISPDARGSFEDAPESVSSHLRRDRRWAQGNLQHLRLIGRRGLHPASRLHFLAGIHSYLSAPVWLALVLLMGSGAVHASPQAVWSLLGAVLVLLVPKFTGVAAQRRALGQAGRRRVLLRALMAELWLTTLFAPIGMLRRSGFLLALLAGRDAGWKPSGQVGGTARFTGRGEQISALAILAGVITPQVMIGTPATALLSAAMVMPVVGPLLAAPWLIRWLDAPAKDDPVARYYDASTARFLAVGGTGAALAIHRPLWADGTTSTQAAAAHANDLIARAALAALGRAPQHVCDLGCGVGGSLFHLARLWPDTPLTGITLSAQQVRLGRMHARALGLEQQCRFVQSDFTLPTNPPRAELVLAIESHVHIDSAARFLEAARSHLAPGGVLVVVDDMLARPDDHLSPRERALVRTFRKGWRLGHVTAQSAFIAQAQALGYTSLAAHDLNALLRLNRMRDHALRYAGPVADWLGLSRFALFANMVGGNALTQAYRAGIMTYSMVVLRAPDTAKTNEGRVTQRMDAA